MPLYEYICTDCGREFEQMMHFDQAEERPPCPDCASPDTRKKLSLFSSKNQSSSVSSSGSCGTGSGGFT